MSPIRKILLVVSFLAVGAGGYDIVTFDRAAWQEDYSRLKLGLAQGYANLDWQVEQRDLDLVALDRRTTAKLDGSFSHAQAYFAMRDFIAAFRDPHLQMKFGNVDQGVATLPEQSAVPSEWVTCAGNGFQADDFSTSLAYRNAEDWQAVADGNFPAGIIGDIGIVRIAEFGEGKYRGDCADNPMEPRALQLATRRHLNTELEGLLETLEEAGAERLVIDLTGNGGGSEWIDEIAAMLSDAPLTRAAPMLANAQCDRAAIWEGKDVCPILAPTGENETIDGRGLWTGPIALMLDNASASATEGFAVWLADNDRAVLVGERTYGAGCGYINGGHAVAFEAVPLHVMMPNCARFTVEGVNEIEGIEPDLPVDLSKLDAGDFPPLFDRAFAIP